MKELFNSVLQDHTRTPFLSTLHRGHHITNPGVTIALTLDEHIKFYFRPITQEIFE